MNYKILQNYKVFDVITYKQDICKILNVEPKTGNTKKKHMKEIEQYMKLEPVGRGKLQITEIYNTPKEKVDGRKGNGKHPNSQKALDEYGHQRTIPLDLVHKSAWYIGLQAIAEQNYKTLFEFVSDVPDDVPDEVLIKVVPQDLFLQLGLYNNFTSQILYNKVDFEYKDIDLFIGQDVDIIRIVLNNLYKSMRDKILCDCVESGKIIVYLEDDLQYSIKATKFDIDTIQEVERQVITEYNSLHGTDLKKYSEIYNKLPKQKRQELQQKKRELLSEEIRDYSYDTSCFYISMSVKTAIEQLELDAMDLEQMEQLGKQLKQQVHELFYNNEYNRIVKNYDEKIQIIVNSKGYGKRTLIKQLEQQKQVSLQLLRYSLAQDLTEAEQKQIKFMLS